MENQWKHLNKKKTLAQWINSTQIDESDVIDESYKFLCDVYNTMNDEDVENDEKLWDKVMSLLNVHNATLYYNEVKCWSEIFAKWRHLENEADELIELARKDRKFIHEYKVKISQMHALAWALNLIADVETTNDK